MKTCVIIPSFNEERSIAEVIRGVLAQSFDVVVVDDGSRDNTVSLAKASGAVVISQLKNRGKGVALKIGFNYALSNDYDAVITMDADGQHDPRDIRNLLNEASRRNSCIVVGNRMSSYKNMPLVRILTNKIMSLIISLICQQDIPDTQCGLRFITRGVLKNVKLSTANYEIESEMLIRAAHKGYRIDSCPIRTIYAGEKSQINPFLDTGRFIAFLIKYYFKR